MREFRGFVYVIEDDHSFRRSLTRLVRASGFEVAVFESANAFSAHTTIGRPACLLLDVRLPDVDGLAFHRELTEKGCTLPVIFMTGHGTIPMGVRAMKDGATDFLQKPFEEKDLLDAIDKALECDIQNMQEQACREQVSALIDALTPREKETLRWVIAGKPNKEIARALGIAEKTVKVHRGRVMEKTGVSSVAELVRLAEKINITPAE